MVQKLMHSSHLNKPISQFLFQFCLILILATPGLYAAGSWRSCASIEGGPIASLTIDPLNPITIYASAEHGGVYKSTDAGDSWNPINDGIAGITVYALAVDPLTPSTLYGAGTGIVIKSTDSGAHWHITSAGFETSNFLDLTIDPINPINIYLSAGIEGVYRSTDAGDSWSAINNGFPVGTAISALIINASDPDILYARSVDKGIFKSTNGGGNWSTVNLGISEPRVYALAIAPTNPDTLYAGITIWGSGLLGPSPRILKTINAGETWIDVTNGLYLSTPSILLVDPHDSSTIYAATGSGGIYKSTDGAASWSLVSFGLKKPSSTISLVINPSDSKILYAGTESGVHKSTDSAANWIAVNHGLVISSINEMAIDPLNPAALYAAARGNDLFKSTDACASWSTANSVSGVTDSRILLPNIQVLAIDPQNTATVYADFSKSTDAGISWDLSLGDLQPYALAIDPQNSSTIYAGTHDNYNPFLQSTDGGNVWYFIFGGGNRGEFGYSGVKVWALAINPQNTSTIFAGTNQGVYRTTNAGWHYYLIGGSPSDVRVLMLDPKNPSIIYAGSWAEGIFKSTDGGDTWKSANNGLTETAISSLVIDPQNTTTIYASTSTGGVFVSTNGGTSWSSMNEGLGGALVQTLAIDSKNPATLYAGTQNSGVWVYSSPYSSVNFSLNNGGVAGSRTPGDENAASVGYASLNVQLGDIPYATAVFSYKQDGVTVTEAGVPASPPTTYARIFIDYRSDVDAVPGRSEAGKIDVNTGIAVVNNGSQTANVSYSLHNVNGDTITVGSSTIPAGNHFANFIHQLGEIAAGFALPADFQNNIGFASLDIASDQPLSIVALRMTTNQNNKILYTTTPVADLTQSLATDPIYFAQFADGGGYTSSLILLNTSTATETGTLQILDKDGLPLIVNQVGGTADSSFNYSIPARGVFLLRTDGSPTQTKVGWVRLTPSAGTSTPVGSGVFSYNSDGVLVSESGVPAALPTTHARVYVDLSQNHNTGLAIANIDASEARITINAFQKDGVTATGTSEGPLQLAANGHDAKFADQLFSDLPADFTGVLDISSTTPFAALTIRSLYNENHDFLMTTFPVADVTRPAPSPIVFPQIADGGGYVTEFILLSPSGASSSMLSILDNSGAPLELGD
jgi:photosystem II stability/assembly factor-like uncharacterized protein